DRTRGRIYLAPEGGNLYMVSLVNGADLAAPLSLITNAHNNKVRGGLNLVGNNLYVATPDSAWYLRAGASGDVGVPAGAVRCRLRLDADGVYARWLPDDGGGPQQERRLLRDARRGSRNLRHAAADHEAQHRVRSACQGRRRRYPGVLARRRCGCRRSPGD
ncbi:MAG: hypothetical protein ABI612_24410, partial [Betaproteobacteria bacterium]